MEIKRKRERRRGWKTQEVRGLFAPKTEKMFDVKTEYINNFCTWSLDDFIGFVQAKASQEVDCCLFSIKDEGNFEAVQRLRVEAALRGIHLPIPVKIVGAYK